MTFIRSSPFRRDENPKDYMMNLVSREEETESVLLNDAEKQLLADEFVLGETISKEFRGRVKRLISNIFEREKGMPPATAKKSFGAALEWVEPYPNIAALAEEVITTGGFGALPSKHGKARIKDRAHLIGCAIALVLLLMTIVVAISFLVARK